MIPAVPFVRRLAAFAAFSAGLLFTGPAAASFYIGVAVASVNIEGDFDGESALTGGGSTEVLPELDAGTGTRLAFGFGDEGHGFELNVQHSTHDGTWQGAPFDSEFVSLNLDYSLQFTEHPTARPFMVIGLGLTNLTIEQGSTDGQNISDASYLGLDGRLGLGLWVSLSQSAALNFRWLYRIGGFHTVDGVTDGELVDDFNGDGTTASAELVYRFGD